MKHFTEFRKFDEDRRLVYGIVYQPEVADSQGDWATADSIEAMAHEFNASNRAGNIDVQHNLQPCGARVVESFIARKGDADYPAGSWAMGIKCPDNIWRLVKAGKINGLSMFGRGERLRKGLAHDPNAKHELVNGQIEAVSLVDRPATRQEFVMTKSDTGIGDALTNIASAIAEMSNTMASVTKRLDENDRRIEAMTSGRPIQKQAQQDPEVSRLLRKRDRLNERLASIWERPDNYEPDAEREVCKSLQRVEDDLYAHGHQDPVSGLDTNSAFYQRGGSSTFITGGGTSIEDILGVGHHTRKISKADEDAIEVENCLVL